MWGTGTEISKHETSFDRTSLKDFRGSCLSEVKDFSTLRVDQTREIVLHPTAGEAIPLSSRCFIKIVRNRQYVSIYIEDNDKIEYCWGNIKICLLDSIGNVVHSKKERKYPTSILKFENFFEKRKLMKDKESLLPDDVLSFIFEYEIVAKVRSKIGNCLISSEFKESTSETEKKDLVKKHETSNVVCSITVAIKSLLEEGALSDVSLRSGSKSFPAHKCILYARSPVFKAMFSGDMKEKTSKCVEIPDLDEDTLRELLSYIYTDTVGELEWRAAADLYRAADKYELLDLKERCATLLKSGLSLNSVCALLVVADMHHDRELQKAALDFVMQQGQEFLKSDEWRSFKEENSKLALETMELIFCNMKTHH